MACINNILRVSDVDVSRITFSSLKTQDLGGKMIFVQHKGERVHIQLPTMTCPYGVSRWPSDKAGGSDKIQLDLSMNGYDGSNLLVKESYDMFLKMEEMLVSKAFENCVPWFKKKYPSANHLQELLNPIIKFSKDKATGELSHKFPPVIRLTIPKTRTGEIETEVYNNKKQRIAFDDVDWKGARVTAIMEISSVYIMGVGKFGMTFKAKQLKVVPVAKGFDKYAFIEDPDDVQTDDA